ncbi:uncharacterized protein LOC110854714 [Folsomia candida]|uniref:uncharacterized protein LOC110854714 n=1 Tax=Folsomia candida TaxID=158441 RepID=UPI000B8FA903|nr:uncharacterized protein LOC110854714 [Folsomia candida]XP_035711275.1 uncharacterized protein LOC110854714 [Folsomia candida]
MQEQMAVLNTALDNATKQAINELQPEIDELTFSLSTVAASLYALKVAIANVESALEETQIVDIVSGILYGSIAEAVFRYEHGVFKRTSAYNAMSTIVTLAYPEFLKNTDYFLNFLNFLSELKNDLHKLLGYQDLYFAVLANGQLYNVPQPFILAYKISNLHETSNSVIAWKAKYFLTKVVHPVISTIVFQSALPLALKWGLNLSKQNCIFGFIVPREDEIRKYDLDLPYSFEGSDMYSMLRGWTYAHNVKDPGSEIWYLLRRGNTLSTRMTVRKNETDFFYTYDSLDMETKCDFHDCSQSVLPVTNGVSYLVFGRNMTCLSPQVHIS